MFRAKELEMAMLAGLSKVAHRNIEANIRRAVGHYIHQGGIPIEVVLNDWAYTVVEIIDGPADVFTFDGLPVIEGQGESNRITIVGTGDPMTWIIR